MNRDHPPILLLAITVLFVLLAIAGGPVVFVLLVMASPLILLIIFGARSVIPRRPKHPDRVQAR
jgi:hypothetical protein